MVIPRSANHARARRQNPAAVRAGLVVEDLGVRESGTVVERGVDVAIADDALLVGWRLAPAVLAPPVAGRDPSELLHINMDQFSGPFALVALDRPSGRRGGGPVADVESPAAGIVEDPLHRRGRQIDVVSDAVCAPTALPTQRQHLAFNLARVCSETTVAASCDRSGRRRPRRGTGHATCARSSRRPGTDPLPTRSSSRTRRHTRPFDGDPQGSAARWDAEFYRGTRALLARCALWKTHSLARRADLIGGPPTPSRQGQPPRSSHLAVTEPAEEQQVGPVAGGVGRHGGGLHHLVAEQGRPRRHKRATRLLLGDPVQ